MSKLGMGVDHTGDRQASLLSRCVCLAAAAALGAAVAAPTVWWLTHGSSGEPDEQNELPDSMEVDGPGELRRVLLDQANSSLRGYLHAYGADLLVYANCACALDRLERDLGNPRASPLMVCAVIRMIDRDRKPFLVKALNGRRETDEVVVLARTPDGRTIRIVRHFPLRQKESSAFLGKALYVEFAPVEELASLGEKSPNGEIVIATTHRFGRAIRLPQNAVLTVAVRDRSGVLSNFVPVFWDRRWKTSTSRDCFGTDESPPASAPAEP